MTEVKELSRIHGRLRDCRRCPGVCGEPVHGPVLSTPIMLVGQAPGAHESALGKPFAYTAGKTLFKWLGTATGLDETELRGLIYFSAVARCFPGKAAKGDRAPSALEIANCRPFLRGEVLALRPRLILAVGRLAIEEVLGPALFPKGAPLAEVVGRTFRTRFHDVDLEVIPLPHPSGVSRWPQTEPGKTKLRLGLELFRRRFRSIRDELG